MEARDVEDFEAGIDEPTLEREWDDEDLTIGEGGNATDWLEDDVDMVAERGTTMIS